MLFSLTHWWINGNSVDHRSLNFSEGVSMKKVNAGLSLLVTFVVVIFCIITLPTQAHGQVISGTIFGTVTDATGAVIPGVSITVTSEATASTRTATTGDAGDYVVSELPPGRYTVTASRAGFAPQTTTGVVLDVAKRSPVNFSLSIGA